MNVSELNSTAEATEHLISVMKGFNLEASSSIEIIDMLNKVGNEYAISSAQIGESLQRSSAVLSQSGNSIQESIALTTAAHATIQSAERVGTAWRTIALRIRSAKSELEELGEETDGMASSSSKLQEEVKRIAGVDIMKSASEFKSTYQIILELSKVWQDIEGIDRTYLLELLGGKRGASVIAAAIQNADDLENSYQAALNAQGSAIKENERYLDSIQGKLDQLADSWQKMWTMTVDSEIVKTLIDMGNAIVKLVNAIGGIDTILVPILGLVAASNLDKIFNGVMSIKDGVVSLVGGLKNLLSALMAVNKEQAKTILSSVTGTTARLNKQGINTVVDGAVEAFGRGGIDEMTAYIASAGDATDATKTLSKETLKHISTMATQAATTEGVTVATEAESIKLAANKFQLEQNTVATQENIAAQTAMKAVIGVGLSLAIMGLVTAYQKLSQAEKERQERIDEVTKAAEDQARSFNDAKNDFDALYQEYAAGKVSEDELRAAMEKVNETLGNRREVLYGAISDLEAYRKKLEEVSEEERNYLAAAARQRVETAEKALKKIRVRGEAQTVTGSARQFYEMDDMGTLRLDVGRDASEIVANYERAGQELAELEKEIQKVEADIIAAEIIGDKESQKFLEVHRRELMIVQKDLYSVRGAYQDAVDDLISSWQSFVMATYNPRTTEQLVDAVRKYAESLGVAKSDMVEFSKSMYLGFGDIGAAAYNATDFIEKFNEAVPDHPLDLSDLVTGLTDEELVALNNISLADLKIEATDAAGYINALKKAIADYSEESKEAAIVSQTFGKALKSDEIDKYQATVKELSDALANVTSGDATGFIDGLQKIQEKISELDLDIELTGKESVEDYKEIVDRLVDASLKNLVEMLNLEGEPGLVEALKAVAQTSEDVARSADEAANGLSSLSSAYSTIAGAIEEYNEKGHFTLSTIESLLKIEPQYLAMLIDENGQFALNEDALVKLANARIDDAKAALIENAELEINEILAKAAARADNEMASAANNAASSNNNLANQVANVGDAAGKAVPAIVRFNKAVSGIDTTGLTNEEISEIEAIRKRTNELNDAYEETRKSIGKGAASTTNEIMGYSSKAAKGAAKSASDASKDIKSAIDSVLSHFKSAMDSGAITYKQYLDKLKSLTDKYQNQLSKEDYWSLRLQHAEGVFDMWGKVEAAVVRYLDDQADAIRDQIDALDDQKDALERNKKEIEKYYGGIIDGYKKQKEALDDQKDAIKDYYEGLMKPLEKEKKALEDNIKAYQKRLKEIEKEEKAINKQIKAYQKQQKPYQDQQKLNDKQIKQLERQIADLEKLKSPYEEQIELLQKQKELLEAANDERERAIALQEAQYALERAQSQRTKMVFEGGQFVYQTDKNAIKDAQKQLDDLQYQETLKAIDDAIADLQANIDTISDRGAEIQKDIDALNEKNQELQDHIDLINESIELLNQELEVLRERAEPINDAVEGLNEQMDGLKERLDLLKDSQDEELDLIEAQIDGIEREIDAYERMKDTAVEGIEAQIAALDEQTEILERQIEEIERYKEKWEDVIKQWERIKDEQLLTEIFGKGWQEKLNSLDPGILQTFADAYFGAGKQMQEVNRQIIESLGSVEAALNKASGAGGGFNSVMTGSGTSGSTQGRTEDGYTSWIRSREAAAGAIGNAKEGTRVSDEARAMFIKASESIKKSGDEIKQVSAHTIINTNDLVKKSGDNYTKVRENAQDTQKSVADTGRRTVENANSTKSDIVRIGGEIYNSVDIASTDVGRAFNSMKSKGDSAVSTANSQTSSIRSTWNNLVSFMDNIRNTAGNIMNGINDRIQSAQNAINNFSFGSFGTYSYRYYAKGGRVEIPTAATGRRITQSGPKHPLAKAVGEDVMIAAKAGEGIFTERQTDDLEDFIKLTPELLKTFKGFEHLGKLMGLSTMDIPLNMERMENIVPPQTINNNRTNVFNFGDFNMTEVSNVSDFARQLKANLPNAVLQELMA